MDELERRLNSSASQIESSLSYSLWQFEEDQIQKQLQGLVESHDVAYAEVSWIEKTEKKVNAGDEPAINSLSLPSVTVDLTYGDRFTPKRKIGQLLIVASTDGVINSIERKFFNIVVFQGVKSILVSVFILILISNILVRHLKEIASYLTTLRLDGLCEPLQINRKDHDDELSIVVDSINLMQEQLITELDNLKEAELQLNSEKLHNQVMLEESKIKSEFLAVVSHEIRTPLNGVIGMLELINQTELTTKQKEYLQVALTSSDVLLNLLNDILDLSKISAGKIDLNPVEFDLETLLSNVSKAFVPKSEESGVQLIVTFSPGMPTMFVGDQYRLRQILENILSNAFKFTRKGFVLVDVKNIEQSGAGQAVIQFSVTDTGIGIDLENPEDVFVEYKQVALSDGQVYGGTGLGLGICKKLVALMGGEIFVQSTTEIGSTFTFSVALDKPEQEPSGQQVTKVVSQTYESILIVGGSEKITCRVSKYFSHWMYRSMLALSFLDAIEILESLKLNNKKTIYILVLDDVNRNELLDFAKWCKENLDQSQVISMKADEHSFMSKSKEYQCLKSPLFLGASFNFFDVFTVINKAGTLSRPEDYPDLSGLAVLVAEDNEVNRQVVLAMLSLFKIVPDVAVDGNQVVDLVIEQGRSYDLILMDCEMPNKSGIEAAKEIRKHEKEMLVGQMEIVAVSAHTFEEKKSLVEGAGMNGFLEKPLSIHRLESTLFSVKKAT